MEYIVQGPITEKMGRLPDGDLDRCQCVGAVSPFRTGPGR